MEGNNKEHINPVLAAGDTSDIVNEESDAPSNNNKTTIKGNVTKVLKENATAKVEKINSTICNNHTKKNSSECQKEAISKTDDKLNSVLKDAQTSENSTQYEVLWLFSKMLEWWSYGYNAVWKVLKSGKCPMPWLTSTRLHCNVGKFLSLQFRINIAKHIEKPCASESTKFLQKFTCKISFLKFCQPSSRNRGTA